MFGLKDADREALLLRYQRGAVTAVCAIECGILTHRT